MTPDFFFFSGGCAPRLLVALALFDGEEVHAWSGEAYALRGYKPPQDARMLEMLAQQLVDYEGYRLVTPGPEAPRLHRGLGPETPS